MGRVTIKDVAKEAGVSISITSFALNNVTGRVSEEVRKKVLECSKRLEYTPNINARNLRTQNCDTIMLVYDDEYLMERNASTMQFMASTVKYAGEFKKDVLVKLINCKSDWESLANDYISLWDSKRTDGIIFQLGVDNTVDNKFYQKLNEYGVNFVDISANGGSGKFPSVYIDDYILMQEEIQFIHNKGYQEIYYLSRKFKESPARERGYIDKVKALGIEGKALFYTNMYISKADIWNAVKDIVENRSRKIAFACWNDVNAINLIEVLHSNGIKVPEDVGVMGFDDIPAAEHSFPALTTVLQPFDVMSLKALEVLLKLNGVQNKKEDLCVNVPGRIIERDSI